MDLLYAKIVLYAHIIFYRTSHTFLSKTYKIPHFDTFEAVTDNFSLYLSHDIIIVNMEYIKSCEHNLEILIQYCRNSGVLVWKFPKVTNV